MASTAATWRCGRCCTTVPSGRNCAPTRRPWHGTGPSSRAAPDPGQDVPVARVKDEDIALVRDRTPIADVISETVTLRSAGGGNLKGLCPFHDEKTPSFTVSPARNVYFCLAGETRVITDQGIREIRDLAGGRHRVITTHGRFVEAPFHSFGEQPVVHLRLTRNGQKKTIRTTLNHRWFIRSRSRGAEKRLER